jgi:hypothetical protein
VAGRRVSPRTRTIIAVVFVVAWIIVVNVTIGALVEADGSHARGHLASAQSPLSHVAVLAVMFWTLPRDRRPMLAWIAALVILVGVVFDTAGNLQVVDAIGGESWSDAQTERLGPSRPGFDEGHDLASVGMWIVVAGAIAFAVIMMVIGAIGPLPGILSIGISLVFPPWIAPGFGLVVVAIALLAKGKAENERSQPVPSMPHNIG